MLKKLKNQAGSLGVIFIILLIIYAVINIIHVLWNITNPEGFWSYGIFIDFLRGAGIALIVVLFVLFLLILLFINIISGIRNGFNKKELLQLLGYLIFIPLISAINYFWVIGPVLYFDTKMSNKYSYINQSEEYFNEGNYQAALENGRDAYRKESDNSGTNSFFVLTKLYKRTNWYNKQYLKNKYAATINYGYCLRKIPNQAKEAEMVFKEALQIANSSLLPKDNNLIIFPSLSLAELLLDQGRYVEAENYFSRALSLSNAIQSEDILYVYLTHEIFARHAERIGDKNKAAQLRIGAFKIYDASELSHKNSTYLTLLINTAASEIVLNHMNKAGELIIKARPLADKRKEKEIYLEFLALKGLYCNLAAIKGEGRQDVISKSIWERSKDMFSPERGIKEQFLSEAAECFEELLEENKSRLGKDKASVSQSLAFLGSFYSSHGKYKEAKVYFDEALKVEEGNKHNNQGYFYSLLLASQAANFYNGHNQMIGESLSQVEDYHFEKLATNYMFFTEEEKESYVANLEKDFNSINSIYANLNKPQFNGKLYNNILALKNVALFSNKYTREAISNLGNSLQSDYNQIIKQKEQFQRIKNSPNSPDVIQTENKLRIQEKAILNRLAKLPAYKPFNPKSLNWLDIKKALKDNEVAIEIINIPFSPHYPDSLNYFALIIHKQSTYPELIPLFKEHELKKILNQKGNTKERINNIYIKNKVKLHKKIWEPIEKHIIHSSHAYVSVSGILHTISFPALLIDHPTPITFLSSTRQLAIQNPTSSGINSAALFGDINYDYGFNKRTTVRGQKGNNNHDNTLERGQVNRLKFTAAEVANIKSVLGNKAQAFTDTSATELSFIQVSPKSNVVHVATHGFYYRNKSATNGFTFLANLGNSDTSFDNPLLRCGILFAGANKSKGLNEDNDGVLTALEISKINLSNVDLVVLSACETGLGDIKGSEGVYGLQRAFKLAGAASTLVSLWKVDDKSTSELMKYFYNFYNQGFSKTESLKLAQLELRKTKTSPFDWAGFILIN